MMLHTDLEKTLKHNFTPRFFHWVSSKCITLPITPFYKNASHTPRVKYIEMRFIHSSLCQGVSLQHNLCSVNSMTISHSSAPISSPTEFNSLPRAVKSLHWRASELFPHQIETLQPMNFSIWNLETNLILFCIEWEVVIERHSCNILQMSVFLCLCVCVYIIADSLVYWLSIVLQLP